MERTIEGLKRKSRESITRETFEDEFSIDVDRLKLSGIVKYDCAVYRFSGNYYEPPEEDARLINISSWSLDSVETDEEDIFEPEQLAEYSGYVTRERLKEFLRDEMGITTE